MGWYKSGDEASKAVNDELVTRELNKKPPRFWLKPGNESQIIFVDDEGITFYEHNLELNNSWFNYFTCLKSDETGDRRCPLCESRFSNYLVTLYTVIDCSEFVDSRGTVRKNERKILAVRPEVAKKILRKKAAQKGSLVGCKFTVFRSSEKSGNSGDDFEFVERVDLNDYKGQDGKYPQSFDYEKFYKPDTYEALSRFCSRPVAGNSVSSPRHSQNAERVPEDKAPSLDDIPF